MPNPNLLDQETRRKVVAQIMSSENKSRKMAEQRKFDIYRKRQQKYVLERLEDEFDPATVKGMRKVLSINPCKRIVDEQASLYVDEPDREFSNADDNQKDLLKEIYDCGKVNPQMRLANRFFKLHGQAALYVLPKDGKLMARALTVKDYDVIPDADDPEKAFAYILNVMDMTLWQTAPGPQTESVSASTYSQNDGTNELIADANDKQALNGKYVFWTADNHFTCNQQGELDLDGMQPNPIGVLPFIDIANEKDFQFFVEQGSDVAEFVIDLLVQLCDLANTVRFQSFAQAIISSVDAPQNINIGPNRVLWLKLDGAAADGNSRPDFKFESPTPDLMGSLEVINVQLKMFLSAHGLNPGTVSGKNEAEKFTSGIDHLLSNLDRFKASKEDMDIFRDAENQLLDLLIAWHGIMKDVTDENALDDDLKGVALDDGIELDLIYHEPQAVQTDKETLDYCVEAQAAQLMTQQEAIMRIYKCEKDRADEIIAELDAQKAKNMAAGLGPDGKPLPVPPITFNKNGDPKVALDNIGKDIQPDPAKPGAPAPAKPGDKPAPGAPAPKANAGKTGAIGKAK